MKVGDYVRTPYGIRKIVDIKKDDGYGKPRVKVIELDDLLDTHYKYSYTFYTDEKIIKEAKHSPNIIDLIEVGDYVNGQEVRYIDKGNGYCYLAIDEDYTYLIAGYDKDGLTMPIKSIVTKESMESVTYYVK